VRCQYHLAIEVHQKGGIIVTRPRRWRADPLESVASAIAEGDHVYTCALDVADEGEHGLSELAEILNIDAVVVAREVAEALEKLRALLKGRRLGEDG
jgi:hypothetical protein